MGRNGQAQDMRLLMITQKIDLNDTILGFTHTWAKELATKLEKLHILALWVGRFELPRNVEVYSMGKERGTGKFKKFISFNKVVSRTVLSKKVDGIFIHMCPLYAILAFPYAKLTGMPMVMWFTHKSTNLILKIAQLLANKILTASEESFRLKSKKKIVTGHGIDVDFFKPVEKRHSFGDNRKVLSVGRISPIKDYETLVEAANILINEKDIKDIEFLIIGDVGNSEQKNYFEKIRELVESYNLKDFIHFVGSVPHQKIVRYYQSCDVFVNLSRTDSLDKAILEAMSCEKLVITSNAAFKQMLGNINHNLTFEKGNYKEMADKMLKLLSLNAEEVGRIGRTLRNMVQRAHSLEGLIDKLILEFHDKKNF